jgi:hypothetical protein
MFLFVANGAMTLLKRVQVRSTAAVVAIFVVVAVDAASVPNARPFASLRSADIKGSLSLVARHWSSGDVLYVHYPSQYAFGYYTECGCFSVPGAHELRSLWPVRRTPVADPG